MSSSGTNAGASGGSGSAPPSHSEQYDFSSPLATSLSSGMLPPAALPPDVPPPLHDPSSAALLSLLSNASASLDQLFYSTPASQRSTPRFVRDRLTVRVALDTSRGLLHVTDYGVGMTRADIINVLAIGRGGGIVYHGGKGSAKKAEPKKKSKPVRDDDDDDDDDDDAKLGDRDFKAEKKDAPSTNSDSADDDSSSSSSSDDRKAVRKSVTRASSDDESSSKPSSKSASQAPLSPSSAARRIDCRSSALGGFFAAACSLATAVSVGTKSSFDEYYTFEFGLQSGSASDDPVHHFQRYTISRPFPEGTVPSSDNGNGEAWDVPGSSGTRITLHLKRRLPLQSSSSSSSVSSPPSSSAASSPDDYIVDAEAVRQAVAAAMSNTQYSAAVAVGWGSDELRKQFEEQGAASASAAASAPPTTATLDGKSGGDEDDESYTLCGMSDPGELSKGVVKERARYIPLRLTLAERKMLRLTEAAMNCSDYTTMVDGQAFKSETRRQQKQLQGITGVMHGLVVSCNYAAGQALAQDRDFTPYENFFQSQFEMARRHKVMNPEKMRSEYGKLIYLMADAASPTIQPQLGFSLKKPLETVYKFLEAKGGLSILDDKYIEVATEEILADGKTRDMIQKQIRMKEKAVAHIKDKYATRDLSEDDIHMCLYSICDNNSFLNSNRLPVDKVIGYLKKYFSPTNVEPGYSLAIVSGNDGARLSHSHERQYYFALQSLTLWRDILSDMFKLWSLAEDDLLSETVTYTLKDTGQGLHRVQPSPKTYKAMSGILTRVKGKVDTWIGSAVIHLGDHNVPNALSFIDKYTQVPRILGPIVACLEGVERLVEEDKGVKLLVEKSYGDVEKLKKDVLHDFFTAAFDGSGADNFYDAGSCIDGRMTSAWNWCQGLSKKPFYAIFKLTGFAGFDGDFK